MTIKSESNSTVENPQSIPGYLQDTYYWAYIHPGIVRWLDRGIIVWLILWGNSGRLMRAAFNEIRPGGKVLQAAYVYGGFSPSLARHVGEDGRLDVIDIIPLQVENCRNRLKHLSQAHVRLADAANPGGGLYDDICCYFLLHEVPAYKKIEVVQGLLGQVAAGGKVVFVDYHRPHRFHPLRKIMYLIWTKLEPYALDLLDVEIEVLAAVKGEKFSWSKQILFGGLYQKVVATRL